MRFARPARSRLTWIAILAILVHAFMPLAHAAMQVQAAAGSLCSTGEPSFSAVLAASQQQAPAVHLTQQCPLCAAGAHFAIVPPAASFASDPGYALALVAAEPALAAQQAVYLHFSARAPPRA